MNMIKNIAIIGMGASLHSCVQERINDTLKDIKVITEQEPKMEITNPWRDLSALYSPIKGKHTKKTRKCNNAKRPKPRKNKK